MFPLPSLVYSKLLEPPLAGKYEKVLMNAFCGTVGVNWCLKAKEQHMENTLW